MSSSTSSGAAIAEIKRSEVAKVVIISFIGSFMEFYDLYIASFAAALAWPAVFFSGGSAAFATTLSLLTFGASYLTAPIGAAIFGHFGDKIGRRNVLTWTLGIMCIGVLGIGLMPPIGLWGSVILLLTFRGIQGIGQGGEFGGAITWTAEFLPKSKWRGLICAFSGLGYGILAASLSYGYITSVYSRSEFLAYAWRIPFLIGSAILIIAVIIRYMMRESPLYKAIEAKGQIPKSPLKQLLKEKWKTVIRFTGVWSYGTTIGPLIGNGAFIISYIVAGGKISPSLASYSVSVFALASLCSPLAGFLSDLMGRRKLAVFGACAMLLYAYPYYYLEMTGSTTGNWTLVALAAGLIGLINGLSVGGNYAWSAEQFETKYRYSGVGLVRQFAWAIGGINVAFIQPVIVSAAGGVQTSFPWIMVFFVAVLIISLYCTITTKETKGQDLK